MRVTRPSVSRPDRIAPATGAVTNNSIKYTSGSCNTIDNRIDNYHNNRHNNDPHTNLQQLQRSASWFEPEFGGY